MSPYLLRTRCTRRTSNRQGPLGLTHDRAPGAISPPHPGPAAPGSYRTLVDRLTPGTVANDRRGNATEAGDIGPLRVSMHLEYPKGWAMLSTFSSPGEHQKDLRKVQERQTPLPLAAIHRTAGL